MHIVKVVIPTRLDRYLRKMYPGLTQGAIEKQLRIGKIKLNGFMAMASSRVISGDTLLVYNELTRTSNDNEQIFTDQAIVLSKKLFNEYLIYEDNNLLAINKPPHLATQGGSKINLSIQHAIVYLNSNGHDLRLVHRLDKDTSGLLLIAKNYLATYKLTKAFAQRQIRKTYVALVHGIPQKPSGRIEDLIKRKGTNNNMLSAITDYKLISTSNNISLIEFIPHTGRTHQLRIHAKTINCPILGDGKYGNSIDLSRHKRMFLHAKSIAIDASVLEQEINIDTKIPESFLKL